MAKNTGNKSKVWVKRGSTSGKAVNSLTRALNRASKNSAKSPSNEVFVRGEKKSYKFRELG